MKISIFESAKNTKPVGNIVFEQYLENIKNGYWQDAVINVRRIKQSGTKEEYQEAKALVPAVTASGLFAYRNAKGLEAHSGFIAIDIDAQDNTDGVQMEELAADVYTYAAHRSIGGDGVVVYVRIDADKHLDAFMALEEYYLNHYKICIDSSCKDVSRLRYVSWDLDLFVNEKAKVFKQYIAAKKVAPTNRIYTQQVTDIEHIINQVQKTNTDLTANYADWVRIGMAFAKEYGEGGRGYFHDVSSLNGAYNANNTDKKYDNFLKTGKGIGIGSFIWLAQQAGLETKTQRTTYIETVAKSRKMMVGQNGGFKDVQQAEVETIQFLKEMEGIEGADVQPIVLQVMKMDATQMKNNLVGDLMADAKLYIKSLDLRLNLISKGVEYKGKNLEDYEVNSLYLAALEVLKSSQKGKVLGKEMFCTILESDVIPSYHPFVDFFNKNAHLKSKGNIDKLLECLVFEKSVSLFDADKLRILTLKWLLGLIMSAQGTYSILCLVLCGKMGKGKTEFFRNLLPKELSMYFAESKLDAGKDDEILMTQKLILLDDEYGGKSKSDAKKMRGILGKQHFTVRAPYARKASDLLRIACLCGTSNEKDVLSDLEGNRRIIPLNIQRIDFEKYNEISKDELFMELYNLYQEVGKEGVFLTDEQIADLNRLTTENEETCQELEAFFMFFNKSEGEPHEEWLTPTEIRTTIEMNTRLKISPKKLGAALRKVGIEPKMKKISGIPLLRYGVLKIYPTT